MSRSLLELLSLSKDDEKESFIFIVSRRRTEVSHRTRTRRRVGWWWPTRKRPTAEEDLPSALAPARGGEFPSGPRVPAKGVVARAEVPTRRRRQGGPPLPEVRRQPLSLSLVVHEARGAARARVRNRPALEERKPRFCLPCGFRQCLAEVRGMLLTLVSCRR